METKVRNPKPPTTKDLKILEWMNEGNRIDSAKALGLFKTTGLRDTIYRLRCAGNEIKHEDKSYVTKEGERKSYREWFTMDYKIEKAGEKVEKSQKCHVTASRDASNSFSVSQAALF